MATAEIPPTFHALAAVNAAEFQISVHKLYFHFLHTHAEFVGGNYHQKKSKSRVIVFPRLLRMFPMKTKTTNKQEPYENKISFGINEFGDHFGLIVMLGDGKLGG